MELKHAEIILKAKTNQKFLYIAILGVPIGMIIKGILGNIIFLDWYGFPNCLYLESFDIKKRNNRSR